MRESPRRQLLFWLGLLILYALHAACALRAERVLWADGAYYLTTVLVSQDFFLVDFSRSAADVLLELPVVVFVKAGVTDLAWLKLAFGLPPFLIGPLCMALCFWMAGPNRASLGYPLASVAGGLMNTELLPIHESRVALGLFWPVLFALLDPLRRLSTLIVGAALSLPFVASYESALVLGPILAVAALERRRVETMPIRRWAAATCLGSATLSALVAVESVIRAAHSQNFAQFRTSWRVIQEDGATGVQLSILLLVLALPWFQKKPWPRMATLVSAGAASGYLVLQCLNDPAQISVLSQYQARIFNVILPTVASVALLLNRGSSVSVAPERNVLGILFLAQVALQLQLTWQWSAFRQVAREELSCVQGVIPVDTALSAGLVERGVSPQWMLGWNFPTLSLLQTGPLKAVLGVPAGSAAWQPFDPHDLRALPNLSRYGVDDGPFRAAMERLLRSTGRKWEVMATCESSVRRGPEVVFPGGV